MTAQLKTPTPTPGHASSISQLSPPAPARGDRAAPPAPPAISACSVRYTAFSSFYLSSSRQWELQSVCPGRMCPRTSADEAGSFLRLQLFQIFGAAPVRSGGCQASPSCCATGPPALRFALAVHLTGSSQMPIKAPTSSGTAL